MASNKHGLSRAIPETIRREVRQRSKFGCVVCRGGITEYEHIDPPFADATEHVAEQICLLCPSCHARVSRGHLSKASVLAAYQSIAAAEFKSVEPPRDVLDFQSNAELRVGGMTFKGGAPTVLKYMGQEIISIIPSQAESPAGINATFFDSKGEESFRIDHNVWVGPRRGDLRVQGQRIRVTDEVRRPVLILRVDAPGMVVIEHLDMRIGDHHILATESRHAFGHFDGGTIPIWHFGALEPREVCPDAAVFEITQPAALQARVDLLPETRKFMEANDDLIMSEFFGVGSISSGIVFCSRMGFAFMHYSRGRIPLKQARHAVFRSHDHPGYLLTKGTEPLAFDVGKQVAELPETLVEGEGAGILIDWSAILHPELPWPR